MRNFGREHHMGARIAVAVILLAAIPLLSVHIQNISMTGGSKYSEKQIEEFLFPGGWGKNFAYAYFTDRLKPYRQIPFMEDHKVMFRGPSRVEVIIYEKSIVGYVPYMNSYMYFNKGGIVVENSGNWPKDIPWITGLDFGQIVLRRALPVEDKNVLEEILNLAQQLSTYEIAVDRIKYDTRRQVTLFIGQTKVTLGNNSGIDGKIPTPSDVLTVQPHLTEISGTMRLENHSGANSRAVITSRKE